ncbi:class I SAM-dependent methyltransferase [Paraburkholderia diazotrophica]|uniref:Methyltransferase domain-containing protein n=1 Tax=Paraburkholderia diazotrophica TaxID=667676 RepID=A0A1H7DUG4_9BURK|nr:class I SAM-dependent methyltransferase [Paraburkholderia diazotrophica]SEK05409.1 Methyltransferase domain-containing protein [Paraburkholderia diazotrophica]
MSIDVSGTEGYAEAAQSLISQWQSISFAEHHAAVLHFIPTRPSRVLDVGAGIGTDAAALAAMGHKVLAVEPVDEFRAAGVKLHPASRIEWLDDSLPDIRVLRAMRRRFDLAMLTAVWMHLDEEERRRAMPNVARLLSDGALLIMSLRHGPIPDGRRMFDVSAEETVQLAKAHGLQPIHVVRSESVQRSNQRMNVTWTRLVFAKGRGSN